MSALSSLKSPAFILKQGKNTWPTPLEKKHLGYIVSDLQTLANLTDSGTSVGTDTPTINAYTGTITTAVTATAALATKTVTLTNNIIKTTSKVFVTIAGYGGTGTPLMYQATPANGSAVILIYNAHATVALSAAMDLNFYVIN